MICPHCGYANEPDAAACFSCGYALAPPKPRRSGNFKLLVVGVILLFFVGAFVAVAIAFSNRGDNLINFFGKRAYLDLGAGQLVLAPGEQKVYAMRNPARSPICRLSGSASASRPGATALVLDSLNLQLLKSGSPYTALSQTALATLATRFSLQTDGANVEYNIVILQALTASDTNRVMLERLQASCYEKW